MKQKKIAIIGHFGGKESITDGQTVKTVTLYEELSKATDWKIQKVDTYYKRKNPIKLMLQTLLCLISIKDIIVLLSGNGMKFFFPLLTFASKVFHTRVYHDVIGGNLDSYIKKYPRFVDYLNSFKRNWVETERLKSRVEACGITNCEVIPNFKRLIITPEKDIQNNYKEPFSFCTFSRVMKEKGIEDAIEAVEAINSDNGRMVCTLDIYGMIDEGYKERFKDILEASSDAVHYRGIVSYNKSVEVIKDYYALLFPTVWEGEGFPGTIVDSFSAGLPVVATDWNSNAELLENEVTGIIYPNDKISNLTCAIEWIISNVTRMVFMKQKCVSIAEVYQPDKWIERIVAEIVE